MIKFFGREFKDKAKFTAVARCPLARLPDSFLAKASLRSLKSALPEGQDKFPDLLAIAGNAFVANLVNSNGDSMATEDALLLYPTFINKPINLEHEPEKIVGTITKSFLTAFDANYKLGVGSEVIEHDSVKDSKDPFNIAIGGYIYADIHPNVAEKVLESNDPESSEYLTVSFSWEVAFDEWNLLVGSKDYSTATLVTDRSEVEKWTPYIKAKGGSGSLPDGRFVSRQIVWARDAEGNIDKESLYGAGIALTMNPAGQVQGVVTKDLATKELEQSQANLTNIKNNISISQESCVTENTNIKMKSLKTIEDVKALNDENAKEHSFANIANVLDAGVNKLLTDTISEKAQAHADEIKAKENELVETKQLAEQAKATADELTKKNADLEAKLNALVQEQEKAAASTLFNERMSAFDSKYELTDADRKAIANRIKGLSAEDFEKVSTEELDVLLADKDKAIAKQKEQAKASETQTPEEIAKEALEKAVATQGQDLPNTATPTADLAEKYKNAFSLENITKTK